MKINSEHGMKLLCCSILIRSAIDWKKVRNKKSAVIEGSRVNREEVRLFLNSSFLNDILAAYYPDYDQQYVVEKIDSCALEKFSIGPSKEQALAHQRIYNANWYRKKKNLSVSGEGYKSFGERKFTDGHYITIQEPEQELHRMQISRHKTVGALQRGDGLHLHEHRAGAPSENPQHSPESLRGPGKDIYARVVP